MSTTTMADRVEEYLAYRRALGYQIRSEGQMLHSFARYADDSGHRGPLTTELALRWARLPERPPGCIRPAGWKWCGPWPAIWPHASRAPRSRPVVCSARPTPAGRPSSTPKPTSPR